MTTAPEAQGVNSGGFDYSLVDRNLAIILKSHARHIKKEIGHQTKSILATGALLIEIKSKLQHGLFSPWVENEIGVSVRTAENYIRAANLASECKSETISLLSPSTLYLLAAMPQDVKSKNLQTLEANDIDVKAFEAQIRSERSTKNERTSERNSDNQLSACEEIAALLKGLLPEDSYRRFCNLITSPSITRHPTSLPTALQIAFGTKQAS